MRRRETWSGWPWPQLSAEHFAIIIKLDSKHFHQSWRWWWNPATILNCNSLTGTEKIYRNIASTDPHHVVPSISNTSKVNPSWSETQCENDWFKNLNKKRVLTFNISFVVFGAYDFKLSVTTIESNKYHLEISFPANTTFDIFYCGTIRHKQRFNS